MNWRVYEKKLSCPDLRCYPNIFVEGRENQRKTSQKSLSAIWACEFRNANRISDSRPTFDEDINVHYLYNQQDAQIFVIRLYFQYTLYMFRTVSVHLQEQSFYKLYVVFGVCRYHTSCCCVAVTARCICIHQIRHTAYKKTAPEDGPIQSETCRAYTENKV